MTAIFFLLLGLALGGGGVYLWCRERLGRATDRLAAVEQTQGQWEDRLKAATGDALLKSQASLLELAEAKLAPIKETLTKFEAQSKQLEDKRAREVTAIGERLREVAAGQEKLRTETGSLVTALRAPHVRGRWGEVQLKRVVELAGMLDYCDFRYPGERARRRRPAPPPGPGRAASRRQVHRRRLEGADRGLPRRGRDRRRRAQARSSREACAAGARAHQKARAEALLGPVRVDSRVRRDVRRRRAVPRRTRRRRLALRGRAPPPA